MSTSDGTNIGWVLTKGAGANAKQGLAGNGLPVFGTGQEMGFQPFGTVPEPTSAALGAAAVLALSITARVARFVRER